MALIWTDRTVDDYVLPDDVNSLAHAILDLESTLENIQNAEGVAF